MATGRILVESRAPSPGATSPRMSHPFASAILLIALTSVAFAQTHTTVRHYKERIDDTPPEIAQAEDAIQKNDFTAAETLLKKAIDKDPKNYQAWFDLGFVLNRLGRIEDSIHAYRQSVAHGYRALEISVARSADGVWFGLHDTTLDRTSGTVGFAADEQA